MKITRRALSAGFLLPPGLAAQVNASQRSDTPARRRATKSFKEVAASLYAWDLVDQECGQIMETLKETAQANSLYLVALMHHEKRPLTDFYFPHNSTRKTYFPEDSRVYWQPHTGELPRVENQAAGLPAGRVQEQGLSRNTGEGRSQGRLENRRRDLAHGAGQEARGRASSFRWFSATSGAGRPGN